MRFLTGVGLGGALPNLVNIAAESTDPSRRGRAVSIMYAGVPLGGAVASGVAILGLHGGDWHSIFLVGGIMPLLVAPAIHILLPPLGVVKSEAKSTSGGAADAAYHGGSLGVVLSRAARRLSALELDAAASRLPRPCP
jgi:AAHS family 3-hydroxyphenylpropionic acid transporter